eukprot:s3921_g5.t2
MATNARFVAIGHYWWTENKECHALCIFPLKAAWLVPKASLKPDQFPKAVVEALRREGGRTLAGFGAQRPGTGDYIRAGDYAWASAMEKRWLSDGGAKPRRADILFREPSLCSQLAGAWARAGRLQEAEMWLSCTEIEKVDRWALVAFVRACVESGELQTASKVSREDVATPPPCRAGAVDSYSASRQKEAEDSLLALVAARATLAKGAELEGVRRWLHRMQRAGIQPRWPVYGRLLQSYAEVAAVVEKYSEDRRPAAAEATLRRAAARGIQVGWTTSAAVLRAHVRAGRAEAAEQWLEEVKALAPARHLPTRKASQAAMYRSMYGLLIRSAAAAWSSWKDRAEVFRGADLREVSLGCLCRLNAKAELSGCLDRQYAYDEKRW